MSEAEGSLAVIFSSELATKDPEYDEAAARMEAIASRIPGFLGIESYREGARGVTISYWESEEAIRAWRKHPEHLEVQTRGKKDWYARYTLRVARVLRMSEFEAAAELP